MKRRIKRKRELRFDADELRDYVHGRDRTYPAWRLERLENWNPPKRAHMGHHEAARLVRARNRQEVVSTKDAIDHLFSDDCVLLNPPESKVVAENLMKGALAGYNNLLGWRP